MPRDRIEIVRSVYDRWGEGDFRSTAELLDPNVVFVVRPGFPDVGAYLGQEGVARYTRSFLEPWTHITIEAEELIPAGDSVLVAVLQSGTGDASGAATELRYFHLWTFRGDVAIRLETIRERDEALAAAGLSSGS